MTVKWGDGQSLGETSIINPPYGTVIPGDGFLSIQIYGANAPKPAGGHGQPHQRGRERDAAVDRGHDRLQPRPERVRLSAGAARASTA